jgi:hypothetical protein
MTIPAYIKALADSKRMAGPEGIDKILKDTGAVAIIAPTTGPAWTIDPLNGDNYGGSSTTLPAVAGYPHLTVPMGFDVAACRSACSSAASGTTRRSCRSATPSNRRPTRAGRRARRRARRRAE